MMSQEHYRLIVTEEFEEGFNHESPRSQYQEDAGVKEYDPLKNLLDPDKMDAAIMQ
jgi:hypothetical protein